MKRQKKFNNEIGDFNGVGKITEAESLFLPSHKKGIKKLEESYESIFDYDKLKVFVNQARKDFLDDIKIELPNKSIIRINSGLTDYIKSSRFKSYNLDLLKASIINAYGDDILTSKFNVSDDGTKQIFKPNYFEEINHFLNIDKSWLIKEKDIIKYQETSAKYSKSVLIKFSDSTRNFELENSDLYRGIGNSEYYTENSLGEQMDFLSIFSHLDTPIEYFEKQMLNSYTLNFRLAEKFMMHKNNQRRALLKIDLDSAIENVFSSFIVSDIFIDGQYEFLCLPNKQDLKIEQIRNDEIMSEFMISRA
jgi:hypothetical protein